jgi:iron complex outermembrane receptor protein
MPKFLWVIAVSWVLAHEHSETLTVVSKSKKSEATSSDVQKSGSRDLGEALKKMPGIAVRSMGANTGRPVIRGASGNRIIMAEDQMEASDFSKTSPDHAVSIAPALASSIQVQRGLDLLPWTGNLVGGKVHIKRHIIPNTLENSTRLGADLYGPSYGVSSFAKKQHVFWSGDSTNATALQADAAWQDNRNTRTPIGETNNSQSQTINGSVGLFQKWKSHFLGIGVDWFTSEYGIAPDPEFGHPNGVGIEFNRKTLRENYFTTFGGDTLRLQAKHDLLQQFEREKPALSGSKEIDGSEYVALTHFVHLEYIYQGKGHHGSVGVSGAYEDRKSGGAVYTANSKLYKTSAWLVEFLELTSKLEVGFGGRGEYQSITPSGVHAKASGNNPIDKVRQRSGDWSLVAEVHYDLSKQLHLEGKLHRSMRLPSAEELYNRGPHLAAYRYEIGNQDLPTELVHGIDARAQWKTKDLRFFISPYYNLYDRYIFPMETGSDNWSKKLPIYEAQATEALYKGIEGEIKWSPFHTFSLYAGGDFVHATDLKTKQPLPFIPPVTWVFGTDWKIAQLELGLEVDWRWAQNRTAPLESNTEEALITNLYAIYPIINNFGIHKIFFGVENAFDEHWRNHLSPIKKASPESGRQFRLSWNMEF